ncbi:hypothetical protein NGM99_16915 [Mesorhizobium sp. RP14(2022)]|uniref:Uncharacterized protein n=1 Tax=Mesorhizobium liriopis TaxID=2953882 RepID=A0ABT1C9E9_9HYPH|nr:hypothetical protein [Mesorhizobium liriopis]MCO6051468.1 hypothetical protein [Mesorhizobium liriopis]
MSLLVGIADPFIPLGGAAEFWIGIGVTLAFGLLIARWCVWDARERNYPVKRSLIWLVAIFGVFALIFYFFRSRPIGSALLALLATIALIVVNGVFFVAGTIIADLWLGNPISW